MKKHAVLATLAAAFLAACGGGSNSLDVTPPAPDTWATQVEATHWGWGTVNTALADGSTIVVGLFDQTATLAPGLSGEELLTAGGAAVNSFVSRLDSTGNPVWTRTVLGTDLAQVQRIAVLADGSSYVAGMFTQTMTLGPGSAQETSLVSAGSQDGFLARLDAQGLPLWAIGLGTGVFEQALDVAVRPNGDVVVTGLFLETLTLGLGEANETTLTSGAGSADMFVACYTPAGALQWAKASSSSVGSTVGWALAALSDGSVAVAGTLSGTATFGPGEANERTLAKEGGSSDAYVARLDANGDLAWVRHVHSANREVVESLVAGPAGDVYAVGHYIASTTFEDAGGADALFAAPLNAGGVVVRYGPGGEVLQALQVANSFDTTVTRLARRSDGGFVVGGFVRDTAVFDEGGPNETILATSTFEDYDGFAASYAADGTLEWVGHARGPGYASVKWVDLHADGTIVATGSFQLDLFLGEDPTPEVALTATGEYDGFFVRVDPEAPAAP